MDMDSPHRDITARRRFWVAIFALVSLGIMAGGLKYYRYEKDYIRQEQYRELSAIAELKVRQIMAWRRERLGDAGTMVRSPFLQQAIADWLQDPGKPGLGLALLEQFNIMQEGYGYGYENVFLVAPDGRILLSVPPDPAPLSPAGKQALEAAVAGGQAVLSDLFSCTQDNRIYLDVAAPVLDHQGRLLAVVVLRNNAEQFLYPLVQSWPTPSRTAETLLIKVEGKDILFLNNLRHREKTALSLRQPLTQTDLPAVQAALGKRGIYHGTDYRDLEVLADLRPVPQSPWFMVAKVDAAEILAEARYRAGITALFVVIFILLTGAVTAYGYRHRQANLYQDLYQAEREQRKAQEEFRTTLYSIGDAVITTDMEGLVKHINPVAEQLTGWLEAEARGKPLEEVFRIINEETRNTVENPAQRVLREGLVVGLANHTLLIARDGTEHPITDSGAPIRDESGAVMGVVLVFRDQTQERAAQKTLGESEALLNEVGQMARVGGWEVDAETLEVRWTPQTYCIHEVPLDYQPSLEEAINFFHPEERERLTVAIKRGLEQGEPFDLEMRFITATGKELWTHAIGKPEIVAGKTVKLKGTFQDITERKRIEEALSKNYSELQEAAQRLEQSRNMLQLIIESVPVRIFWKDRDLRYLGCNTLFARDAGFSHPQELLGKDDFVMGWKEQAELYRSDDRQVMESCRPQLNLIEPQTTPTGAEIWLSTSKVPLHMPNGEVLGVLGVYEDITDRKRAEEAFRVLVNKAPMGIFIVQDGKCQMVNPGFQQITGYTAQELLGHDSRTLVHPDYREMARERAIRMLKGNLDLTYEFPIITKSGETRWVIEKITSTVYRGKRAVLGYFLDISEHKSLEDQFLQAQKMEAVGTLAGGIAHDFNNILTAILGNIGLAALDSKIGPRVQDRLAQAEEACLRAQALSQQLLTFAKGGAPVKKLFSVAELLTESTAFTCVGSAVKCETIFPENLWWIEADPGQIGQVFQNLTINAIQAMPTGGTIKVWAENLTSGTESGLPLSPGRYIKISVRDQGMGIPADHLPKIFDPYFTTKQKGSGLGLASAYAIIKNHHGHIVVESKPGAGTTFDIYLPAIDKQVTPQPEQDRALLVGTGKILVMDDEDMVREVLGRLLARLGYEAEFAGDGGEAIKMFFQAHGSGQLFAAVILDLTVPGGMGGKETMTRLLEIDPQVKAIVSSGYSDDPIMADFQKYGFSGVIAKPYRISELGKILHDVIMEKA